jgi:tryptophan-rich sensory protein
MNPEWYLQLHRPPLTPPGWVFGPVWTVLYLMIAVSILWWAFRATDPFLRARTWKILALHLLTNACWTFFFFGLQNPLLALMDILLLDFTLWWILMIFRRESRAAWGLLLPYFVWVHFATYLNAGFWWLNR